MQKPSQLQTYEPLLQTPDYSYDQVWDYNQQEYRATTVMAECMF